MALIKCLECGREISDKATDCPCCGYPLSESAPRSVSHVVHEAGQLIGCPDCGSKVSNRAMSCPSCGCPISSGPTTLANPGRVQTTEQTSKLLKLGILLSFCIALGGCLLFVALPGDARGLGCAVFVIGLTLFILYRVLAWWHHG
jgi:hypothetical protein